MTIENWTAKLNSRLLRMKVGLKIAFGRRRSVAIVTTEKVLHANILAEISKVIGPNGLEGEFKLNDLVERIVKLVLNSRNPAPTLRDRINVETNELSRAGFFRFAQVCGVIGLWELNLRIFAARLEDALAENQSAIDELGNDKLKLIAHEVLVSLRQNVSVDWAHRESVRARLRVLVKKILRIYGYPPVRQDAAVQTVLQQTEVLCRVWMPA